MLFTIIYAILAIVLGKLAKKLYDRILVDKIFLPDGTVKQKYSLKKITAGIAAGLFIAFLIMSTFIVAGFDMFVNDYWLFFGKNRISKMESRYEIVIDDNVKPKRYTSVFGGPDGSNARLEIVSRVDGKKFAENNCKGTLINYAEGGREYWLDGDKFEDIGVNHETRDFYRVKGGRTTVIEVFPQDDGTYLLKIF